MTPRDKCIRLQIDQELHQKMQQTGDIKFGEGSFKRLTETVGPDKTFRMSPRKCEIPDLHPRKPEQKRVNGQTSIIAERVPCILA